MKYQFDDYEYTVSKEREDGETFFLAKIDELEAYGEGKTPEEAVEDLKLTFDDIMAIAEEDGLKVHPPIKRKYSGKVSLRITPYLHEQVAREAKKENISINNLINTALAEFIGRKEAKEIIQPVNEKHDRVTS